MQSENGKCSRVNEFDMKTRGLKCVHFKLFAQEDWAA